MDSEIEVLDIADTLFTSPVLLEELAEVLSREKFSKHLTRHGITPDYPMQRYGKLASVIHPALTI